MVGDVGEMGGERGSRWMVLGHGQLRCGHQREEVDVPAAEEQNTNYRFRTGGRANELEDFCPTGQGACFPSPWLSGARHRAEHERRLQVKGESRPRPMNSGAYTVAGPRASPPKICQSPPVPPLNRRKFLQNGALFSVVAGVSWQFWGRRPMPYPLKDQPAALPSPIFITLASVCGASLEDDRAGTRVAYEVDRFLLGAGLSQAADLALALQVLELAPGGLFSATRFSRLDLPDRIAVLDRWLNSSWALRRQIAMGMHKAARFTWWARPENWVELDYDGPWVGRLITPP